jgi:hypothetical protein
LQSLKELLFLFLFSFIQYTLYETYIDERIISLYAIIITVLLYSISYSYYITDLPTFYRYMGLNNQKGITKNEMPIDNHHLL